MDRFFGPVKAQLEPVWRSDKDGRWAGRTRSRSLSPSYLLPSHDMQLKHIEFHILVLSFSLHWAPRRRGREESTFGSRFGSTTLSDGMSSLRKTEKPRSGDDHVAFMLAEQALGRERRFGGVDKEVSGASEDHVDWEGRECVDRTFKSRRLSR